MRNEYDFSNGVKRRYKNQQIVVGSIIKFKNKRGSILFGQINKIISNDSYEVLVNNYFHGSITSYRIETITKEQIIGYTSI